MQTLKEHLSSYVLKIDKDSIDLQTPEKCIKELRRFIADNLAKEFPIIAIDLGGGGKLYKIDIERLFAEEPTASVVEDSTHPIDMGKPSFGVGEI